MTFPQMTHDRVKAMCADGVERTFHQTGQPDTFFSVPGFVHISTKTPTRVPSQTFRKKARVYGFLTQEAAFKDGVYAGDGYKFTANRDGKNADMIVASESVNA